MQKEFRQAIPDRIQGHPTRAVSYLSPNLFWFYEAIVAFLDRTFHLNIQFEQGKFDPLDDPQLYQNQWDFVFICGLPFARYLMRSKADLEWIAPDSLIAIAAPVMQSDRYQSSPIYFADVIVTVDSPYFSLSDLAGKTLCYNDRGSNSGYNLLRQRILEQGYPAPFFAQAISSGFHQQSMRWVAEKLADCAAIDSVVLEQELRDFPELQQRLRVIDSIGACPMPPIAVSQRFDTATIQQIQAALLQPDTELQIAMTKARIRCLAPVRSEDYTMLAVQYQAAIEAGYEFI